MTKPPTAWTPADVVEVAQFAAEPHAFGPDDIRQPLGLGLGAKLSPADNRRRLRERLATDLALTPRSLRDELEMAVRMVDDLRCSEEALPRDRWRIVHSDFAPHNILLDRAGLCVVDWESAGWDDPSLQILDFVLHEATRGLAPELTRLALATYLATHPLDDAERERWRQIYWLHQLRWISGFLGAFNPAYLARKRFANPGLDVAAFQAEQVAKLRAHLGRVVDSPPDPLDR